MRDELMRSVRMKEFETSSVTEAELEKGPRKCAVDVVLVFSGFALEGGAKNADPFLLGGTARGLHINLLTVAVNRFPRVGGNRRTSNHVPD
jgi:hypothetical protein